MREITQYHKLQFGELMRLFKPRFVKGKHLGVQQSATGK